MDKILIEACGEIGVDLDSTQASLFMQYKRLLLEWNAKMNLTTITDDREIIIKHFVDSVSLLPYLDAENKSLIDVGTGAGFPGIPIKIASPSVCVTLVDSLLKRTLFINEVIDRLSLLNANCFHMRAEEGARGSFRESFDICVSRAVAELSVLSEYCIPFVKQGGFFVSFKGPECEKEAMAAEKAISVLGGKIEDIKKVKIPFSDIVHSLIMIKKVRQTPVKYPRKPGKISKSPIK